MIRPERRVFGKDITNLCNANDKPAINNKIYKDNSFINLKENNKTIKLQTKQNSQEKQKNCKIQDPIHQYIDDITSHMLNLETKFCQQTNQKVTKSMRQILMDWLIDVHMSFQLKEQTLHLAFSYLNTFQSKAQFSKQQYQLVGITCLWIASKYQQIYPPRMANYVDVTANTYTLMQLRRMEEKVLETLKFNLNHVTMISLLQAVVGRNQELTQLQRKAVAFTKYILQNLIVQGGFLHSYNPSKLVSTALLVSNSIFKTKLNNKKLQQMKKYQKQQIYQCYKQIVKLIKQQKSYGSNALRRKYQSEKYFKVGKLKVHLKNEESNEKKDSKNQFN